MILLAFDRDETVETGNRVPGPITINLIKKLHARPFIDVWAIGNQRLVEEANIPGLEELARQLKLPYKDIRGIAPRNDFPSVKARNISAKYVRLKHLCDLYEAHPLTQRIVIDNFDLSHNHSHFKHYYPQDFLELINNKGL